MAHAGKADHRLLHCNLLNLMTVSAPNLESTRYNQRSFETSVFAPSSHNFLKCAYSAAQVGSSRVRVCASSKGRPLGSVRVLWVNFVDPHLHSEEMCAEPFSASMSHLKSFRHINSVISSSTRGRIDSLAIMT